ncbi:alpha-L-rhamnosidase [Lacticaseibacillus manihotivorans]|nr:alpha-L-rhamnosidase [Lacticaseibacillus manihotivorans]QFQ91657.1 Bacterial alpha-L-rhamnosidase [Lacticaseibacillus manihotivorans]
MKYEAEKRHWMGRWISAKWAFVNDEPKFTLAQMFGGMKTEQQPVNQRLKPAVIFERKFVVDRIKSATLAITAQGIYQVYLNHHLVSDALFAPDFTAYSNYLQFQEYDVSEFVKDGSNLLQIVVADGWYAGRVSVQGGSAQFGHQLAALADLKLCDDSGKCWTVGTDEKFIARTGKWRYADLQIGEMQDLRLIDRSTETPAPVKIIQADYQRLAPQTGPQVHRQISMTPVKCWQSENGWVIDFGQVLVGRVKIALNLAWGQKVVLEYAEVLKKDGTFFKNIIGRNKDQTDIFVGRGRFETLEPDFTVHGFRYVQITGITDIKIDHVEAEVIFSDLTATGKIQTSDDRINRLLCNVLWSQRGNMLSIPTDCPQRERMGWTGDMQVFAPASTFYYDTQQFIRRWLKSVRIDQQPDGQVLDYSPAPRDLFYSSDFTGSLSSAGWGDAIIMVPWTLYQRYGDETVLAENYQAMLKWHHYAVKSAAGQKNDDRQYLWDTKFHYGDWMLPSIMKASKGNPMATSTATKDVVATAFLAHSSEVLAQVATVLGQDPSPFDEYATRVKRAFTKYYVTRNLNLVSDYQGCYVLALAFSMVPDTMTSPLTKRLVDLIHQNGNRLDTGFLSTPYLLDVLVQSGNVQLAKDVFLQSQSPSWLYEVDHGATTIWETWEGISQDGTVGAFSFNHYAMGCVLDWFVRDVVGLKQTAPGFSSIEIAPKVDLVEAYSLSYKTKYGLIQIRRENGKLLIKVPAAISADVKLPHQAKQTIHNQITVTY